jgi:uncharacterized protein (TIGR03437 family)
VRQAEIYNPAAGTFSVTGSLPTSTAAYKATPLNNGDVLFTGGLLTIDNSLAPFALTPGTQVYHPVSTYATLALSTVNAAGQGAIWNGVTGQLASPDNPATAGNVLSLYIPGLVDGGVIPPQVSVGGRLAGITFFGNAPGYPGYHQVNFLVPAGVTPGSGVPVRLTYLGRSSNSVTIAVH